MCWPYSQSQFLCYQQELLSNTIWSLCRELAKAIKTTEWLPHSSIESVTTNCLYKLSQQTVITNHSKVNCISFVQVPAYTHSVRRKCWCLEKVTFCVGEECKSTYPNLKSHVVHENFSFWSGRGGDKLTINLSMRSFQLKSKSWQSMPTKVCLVQDNMPTVLWNRM